MADRINLLNAVTSINAADVTVLNQGGVDRKLSISQLDARWQASSARLTAIAALATTDGNIIVGDGTTWVAESGAAARTSLGLGSTNSPTFASVGLTGNLTVDGNTVLGNASGDTLTINGTAVSCPNNLNFDSNTLFIGATNNRVGVGTAAPSTTLEIFSISNAAIRITSETAAFLDLRADENNDGSNDAVIRFFEDTIAKFAFGYDSDLGILSIDSGVSLDATNIISFTSGRLVGIAKTSPNYRLDVNGTFGFTPGTSVTPVDNGDVVFEFTNNTTLTIRAKGTDGTVRSGTVALS
jgi:hypothetical protein